MRYTGKPQDFFEDAILAETLPVWTERNVRGQNKRNVQDSQNSIGKKQTHRSTCKHIHGEGVGGGRGEEGEREEEEEEGEDEGGGEGNEEEEEEEEE